MKLVSRKVFVVAVIAAMAAIHPVAAQDKPDNEIKRVNEAATVLDEIMGAPDKAVPRSVLEKAAGIAVFPSLLKGGIGIGAQRGHGVLLVRGKSGGWSNPAFLTITGGSVGAQFGLQAIDLVLVINNERGLEQLVSNQFKIGADAGVAAGPVGRDASASTDIQMRAQILSYSRSRGLFAGVTLNGSTIRQDRDANERFYGVGYRTGQVVYDGMGTAVDAASVAKLKETIEKYGK